MNQVDVKNEREATEFCQQCPNHCPVSELQCGRGRKYFEGRMNGDIQEKGHADSESLYGLLRGCGHYLHHRKTENDNSAMSIDEQLFGCLNSDEQEALKVLLKKLQENWGK